MWSQYGLWPPTEAQDPSYAAYPSWWTGYSQQEQEPYYKPYPGPAVPGPGFPRSPPAPPPAGREFLTPPSGAHGEAGEELTPPDSDGNGEDKPFQCGFPNCRYETNRRNNLKRHMLTMHERLTSPNVCCGKTFFHKADMRAHTKLVHTEGYPCTWPGCGKGFVRKALLDRHIKIHTGEKPFICPFCQYGTSHKSNLDRHMRIHLKPPLSPGKFWAAGQYDPCTTSFPPRPEGQEAASLPDSTTDPAATPRRHGFLFSPDKLGFSLGPFSPAALDLASITPLQLSPEKAAWRGDPAAWYGASLSPCGVPGAGAPPTPPTPTHRPGGGSIKHGIAAILGPHTLADGEAEEENIDVDGEDSEEETENGNYVPKKMRLVRKI
jgi:hypothetical protein